jgi:hypothetical protein
MNTAIVGAFNILLSELINHPDKKNQQRNLRLKQHHRANGIEPRGY